MENYSRHLKASGKDMYSDSSPATRLPQRPTQRKGVAFEDFGSDFAQRPKRSSSSKHAVIELGDSSDDELDFLSSSSRPGSESPVKPKKHRKTPAAETLTTDAPPPIAIDHHQADPNYRPLDFKKLKITKKSSAAASNAATPKASAPVAGPSSAVPSSTRIDNIAAAINEAKRRADRQEEKAARPVRERSPYQDRTNSRKSYLPEWDNSDEEKDAEKTPRPTRPAPRPAYKGANSKMAKLQTVADMQSTASQETDKGKQKEKAQHVARSKTLQALAKFPLSFSDDDASPPRSAVAKGKVRAKESARLKPTENIPPHNKTKDKGKQPENDPIGAIFGDASPQRSPVQRARKRTPSDFPMPSPLSSPSVGRASSPPRKSQTKSHRVVVSEDEGSETGGRSLRPFPMETQTLESLKRVSPAKRSTAGSDAEATPGTSRKRPRRSSPDKTADSFACDKSDSDSDLDNMFLDPSVDPKTLCPWCDERLPSNPTPHLVALMDAARRRSYTDDRPTNPLGLRAPPTVFVGVCQRHRFERVWIPRARRRGWPTHIDWGKLRGRVERLKAKLQAIVDDVDEDFAPRAALALDVKGKGRERRPRKENEFWQEVVKNVREQGSRQTTGVRGQFLHFNKTQPGYYGELGYMIIHQTLCDLFPPASFDPAAALPLTPADFIGHVLVPEAAVRLIMEDLGLGRAEAIKTLRESVEYGVAMFPADEGEGGRGDGDGDTSVLTAGERIIMERARVRRKELEEEERREAEEERRAQSRAGQTDTEPDIDVNHAPPSSSQSTKPKPRLVSRRKPPSSAKPAASRMTSRSPSRSKAPESDDGVIDVSSDTGHSTDASRSGAPPRRRRVRDEPPSSKSDAPTDPGGATPRPKPRPRPRVVGRAALGAAASQPDVRHSQRAEVDVRMPASDPPIPLHDDDDDGTSSSSQSVQFLSWDRKPASNSNVRRGQTEGPVDATPRPKARLLRESEVGKSSASSSGANRDDAGARPRYPLQMAKERRQERTTGPQQRKASGYADGWLPNLRAREADEPPSSDEDVVELPGHQPLTAGAPRRVPSGSGRKDDENQWGWLLSDGSSAGSRTSSFANFD